MIMIMLSRKLGELRVTQAELAERVSLEHLDKICEALDCDLSEIVVYTPNTSKTVDKCESQSVYKQKV